MDNKPFFSSILNFILTSSSTPLVSFVTKIEAYFTFIAVLHPKKRKKNNIYKVTSVLVKMFCIINIYNKQLDYCLIVYQFII